MSRDAWVVGIAVGYLLLSLAVGIFFGRRTSAKEAQGFVAANRTFGLLLMYFVTGATIFSSFAFLGMPGWAYEKGAASFYILSYGAVAMVPLYFFGPKVAKWGRRHGYLTQADFVGDRFGSSYLPCFMAVVSLLAFVPYLMLQMKGAGFLLSAMTGGGVEEPGWISEEVGAALPYLIVVAYVLVGGVTGVGATNVLQGVFMLVIAWTLGLYIPWKLFGGIGPMFERIAVEHPGHLTLPGPTGRSPWTYSSDVLVSVLGFTMWPHLFMKIFTSKSDRVLRQTVVLYPTFLLFLVPILFLGFAGLLFAEGVKPDAILPHLVSRMELPAIVIGLFCAGGLAASMSSGDAIVHAASSVTVRDFLARVVRLDSRQEALAMKIGVVLLGAVSYVLAISVDVSLVNLLLMGYGGVVQFFPLVIAGCYVPRATRAGAAVGLTAGVAVTLLGTFVGGLEDAGVAGQVLRPFGLHPGVMGLVVNVAAFVLVSAVTKPPGDTGRFFGEQAD